MGGRRNSIIEGVAYFFALKTVRRMHETKEVVEAALRAAKSGRVIDSGTSFFDKGTYSIEFETCSPEAARESIERVCALKRISNYEVVCE